MKNLLSIQILSAAGLLLLSCSSREVTGVTDVESGISAHLISHTTKAGIGSVPVHLSRSDHYTGGSDMHTSIDSSDDLGYVHFPLSDKNTYTLFYSDSTRAAIEESLSPSEDTVLLVTTEPTSLTLSFATTNKGFCFIPGTPLLYPVDPVTNTATFPHLPREIISSIAYIEDTTDAFLPKTLLSNIDLTADTASHYILIDTLWAQPFKESEMKRIRCFFNTDTEFVCGTEEQGIWHSSDMENWSNITTADMADVVALDQYQSNLVVLTSKALYFMPLMGDKKLVETTPEVTDNYKSIWVHNDTLYLLTETTLWRYSNSSWLPPLTGGTGLTGGVCEPNGTVHLTSSSGTWEIRDGVISEITNQSEQFNSDSLFNPLLLPNGTLITSSNQGGFWHYNSERWFFYNNTTYEGHTLTVMHNDTLGLKVASDYNITTFTVKESLHSSTEIKSTIPFKQGKTVALFKSKTNKLYVINSEIGVIVLNDCTILE